MVKSKKTAVEPAPGSDPGGSQTGEGGNLATGDGSGEALPPIPDEPSAVTELEPGEMDGAIASLGESVRQAEGATLGYDLSEEAHRSAIEESEQAATDWVLDPDSLVADARDFMLEQIKRRPKPWPVLRPAEQRDVAAAAEHAAQELVRKIVEAVAARGQNPVRVFLEKVTLGEKIQISGTVKPLGEDEEEAAVMLLHHARGKNVLVIAASKDDYQITHREAETDVEEPPLDFEAGHGRLDEHDDHGGGEDEALEPAVGTPDSFQRTGDLVQIDDHGLCEVQVNLKTGMVEAKAPGADEFAIDVRQATPDELGAERERVADFSDDESPLSPMPEIGSGDE